MSVLETAMQINAHHPLALHLYIHAVEASPEPGKADAAADRLRDLQPGLGHMVHMPSHIDVRRGRWQMAIDANTKAILADSTYRQKAGKQDFYHFYMAHNHHMLAFAAMMQGEYRRSLNAVRDMLESVPPEWIGIQENAAMVDGYLAAPFEVQMRFGKWDETLAERKPAPRFPIAGALWHHARGVALAAKKHSKEAREELAAFRAAAKAVPPNATFGNNKAVDLFAVADAMLEGEIFAQEGDLATGIAHLRRAVAKEDTLRYDEPPGWIIPVRHALGAFLIQHGRHHDAEKAYREDLARWPNNGWSLFGLASSLESQGRKEEAAAVRRQFELAWQRADVRLTASCLCAKSSAD